jgi:MOSC domain-containing protein YiiM
MKTRAKVRLFIGGVQPLPESGRPTGMYKQPVTTAIEVGFEGFVGDQQADRRVHGGVEKAIHQYPVSHYAKLAAQFPDASNLLIPGSIGENISADIDEDDVRIGDIWRLGSSLIQVCQPRNPCWKIDERYRSEGMALFISQQQLTGWYWRVLEPGTVLPDDDLILEMAAESNRSLFDSMSLWAEHRPSALAIEQLAASKGIANEWKRKIEHRLDWLIKNGQN